MPSKLEIQLEELVKPIVESFDYEYVGVEFVKKKEAASELIVYIDKPGGIDFDDCERVSRALDEPLDEKDPIPTSYVLCVSSPGLDRPLKTDRDFERSMGSEVDVKLYEKMNGKKELTGVLKAYSAENIEIEMGGKAVSLDRKNVALIRLHLSF